MKRFNIKHLKELSEIENEPAVSIYVPLENEWDKADKNIIRYKNMLGNVEDELEKRDYKKPEIEAIMAEPRNLIDDTDFWKEKSKGFAAFFTDKAFSYYRLPMEFSEESYVSKHFYIKPLLPLVTSNGRYYTLALDLGGVKLYESNRYGLEEVELPKDTPESFEESTAMDDPEKSVQFHTGTSNRPGDRAGQFHGHGTGSDDAKEKKQIKRFFEKLNKGVMEVIAEDNVPMIIAGLGYLAPIYRETNSYPHLIEDNVDKDASVMKDDELHKKTWEKVEPLFKKDEDKALEKYGNQASKDNATTETHKIVKAAVHQRIDTLLLNLGEKKWGRYDDENNQFIIDPEPTKDNVDLYNYAARNTIANNGSIFTLSKERMPNGETMAAIMRF